MQKFISMSLKLTLIICWTTVPIPISSLRSVSCHSYTKTCVYVIHLCACTCFSTCHHCLLLPYMSPLSTFFLACHHVRKIFACFYRVCPRDAMPGFILSTTSVVFGFCLCLCLHEAFYILKLHVSSVVNINAIRIEAV